MPLISRYKLTNTLKDDEMSTQSVTPVKDKILTKVHVRALMALVFTIGLTAGFFLKLIEPSDYKEIAVIAIVWYFSKSTESDNA